MRQAATLSGYGWKQRASYIPDTLLPSTSIQSTPVPSLHCTPATSEHITQHPTVSSAAGELVTELDNQLAAEYFHTFANN
jgi:hypothetical protein